MLFLEKPWRLQNKNRDIKPFTTEARRNYLSSEPNYHTTKKFYDKSLAIETKRTPILMNNPLYLGLSILKISKVVMCEFWYDNVKPKQGDKTKLYYVDIDSFIAHITEGIYIHIPKDVEARFDTSNYDLYRPLSKIKTKKLIGLMNDEIEEKIMREFAALRPKPYNYLINDGDETKKSKGKKKKKESCHKAKLNFENHKPCQK